MTKTSKLLSRRSFGPADLLTKKPPSINPSIPSANSQSAPSNTITTTSNSAPPQTTSSTTPSPPTTTNQGDTIAPTFNTGKTASSQSAPSAGHRVPLPTPDSASKNLSAETDSRGTGPGSAPDPAADRLHSPGLEKATSPSLFKPASPAPGTTASASVQQDSTTSATPLNTQQSTTSTAGTGQLTILKCDDIRAQVISIHNSFSGTKTYRRLGNHLLLCFKTVHKLCTRQLRHPQHLRCNVPIAPMACGYTQ
ncbi:hypothetical protein PTTG_30772 [Puccinia triticina 1-1 BBBD Race 1]|uniref:Uncharacterized protein n=1 Tax=Puccinia triticina (isolate 1-1 / race 1 (BBBD)) TaxID=630390 RepID=A0A180FXH2_PUCT1|nr:hypothetical protein PTTG_30772 [Puccinia triticina 1-1 BBBD Race 1]